MSRILLEVAVESFEDALAATEAGADRLELGSQLHLGGLTPPVELFARVRATVSIPIVVMIRPRAGGFCYTEEELKGMAGQIEAFQPWRPDGFVFGAREGDGSIDRPAWARLRASCGAVPAVFHRAWDEAARTRADLEALVALGFARLLTSGGADTALAGSSTIRHLMGDAGGRIEILPGAGIVPGNVLEVVRRTGCTQVHGTFKKSKPTDSARTPVDGEAVRATRRALDQLTSAF